MSKMTFDFRKAENQGLYSRERGFGFVTEGVRREDELLKIPELNAGFDVPYWYQDQELTEILRDEKGCYVDSPAITRRMDASPERLIPLCFKADVREPGNYKVEITLHGQGEICVFAGPRRLVYREILPRAQGVMCSFVLNVCDIIPRGRLRRQERRSIDIAIVGKDVRLTEAVFYPVDCPTLYIAGDSTVTDQSAEYPYAPGTSYCGWGQMISCYISEGIAVSNHAHSGLTVESFRGEGHYAIIQDNIKPGDYLMLQFGHNDQKLMHLQARGGYREGLAAYVEEAVQKGAYPVIVTPLARNSWKADDGTYNDLLEQYADVCVELGRQYRVPVVDLHGRSMAFVKEKGLEDSKAFFFPRDFTHTNDYGAYKMAGFIVEDYLEKVAVDRTEGYQPSKGTGKAQPAGMNQNPPDIAGLTKSPEAGEMKAYRQLAEWMIRRTDSWEGDGSAELPTAPEKYRHVPKPEGEAVLFADLERPGEPLQRAEALDMVIKTARFFPTNVFNDLYEDIVGHEWYAGTVECAYQNGIIPPQMVKDHRFEPEKPVSMEEFLALVMGGYKSRKKMPEEVPCVGDTLCEPYCRPYVRAACSLGVIQEGDDLKAVITRGRGAEICRVLDI